MMSKMAITMALLLSLVANGRADMADGELWREWWPQQKGGA
jgi:hypothetical protein